MKGVRLKALGVALLGALALMFAGCGQQGGGSQAPTKGSLTVNVSPADAQVQVTGPGNYSQSFQGGNTLTNLDPGDYTVQASKAGYFTANATHKVEAGKITTVVLNLLPVPASGPTEGKVAVLVVNGNGSPISGATVSDGSQSATTNAQGRADLTYTAAGTYAISVNAAGYLGDAKLASVELGKTVALTFKLQPQPAPAPTTGTLVVHVYGADTGQTLSGSSVVSNPALTFSGSGGLFTATADPGTYAVTASALGYLSGSRAANVEAGKTTVLNIGLQRNTASGPVGNIEIVSVKDQWGADLPVRQEVNPAKDVNLYASQTEEPVCVTVRVTRDGQPVQNARVRVSALGLGQAFAERVHLSPGCVTAPTNELDFVMTDSQGIAKFTIYSVGGDGQIDIPFPVKFVVSASEQVSGWTAQLTEFKVFFFNITHLFFQDRAGTLPQQLPPDFWAAPGNMAQKRTGHSFGTIVNFYSDNRDQMAHSFNSYVQQKQPADPQRFYPDGLNFYMEYAVIGGNTGDVQWTAGCDNPNPGLICQDTNGSGVSLNLKPTVTKDQLPKEVTVRATMYVRVAYGTTTYTFPLKSYTFTKRWESAFLRITKYVDNHVLTWAGPSRTLAARDDSNVQAGSVYTSTVHVVVTNPSQNPLYNVVVRDALPPELGVVTSSISNNGVYDPVNHSITWSYTNFTQLAQVNPGQTLEFTFQVYVRQKPGFCANPDLVPNPNTYIIPPLYGVQGIATEPGANDCGRPYDDPYRVTNGIRINDVTASGYLQPNFGGPQVVFDYTPSADESDIWAVRPLMRIEKRLKTVSPITQGASALFEVAVTHIDRSTTDYASLKALYPWEFGNNVLGTGHRSPTYQLRTNTYLRNVQVTDIFENGLKFTDASNFSGVLAGGLAQPYNPVNGKRYSWTPMDIAAGATATAQIFLAGDQLTLEGQQWDNCAFLGGPQLNQPRDVTGTAYLPPFVPGYTPWTQSQLTLASDVLPLTSDSVFTTTPALVDSEVAGKIASCAGVEVVPPPPSPFLALTSHGEFNTDDPFTNPTGQPSIGTQIINLNPGGTNIENISVGTTFWYKGTIYNGGGANALQVNFTATLTGTQFVQFVVSANTRIYVLDSAGFVVSVVNPTSINATTVTFSNFSIPAGGQARVVLQAQGIQVGQQRFMELAVNSYANNTYPQPLPLSTTETTTIVP
jgi:uncharacterized repeat protein (TIGR01451 family)